jgi:glutamyl-tRNA reductase
VLLCVSSSHKNAPFSLLGSLSGARDAARTLAARHEFFTGAVAVATCNRFEAYLDVTQPTGTDPRLAVAAAWQAISEHTGVDVADLRAHSAVYVDDDAAEHLFSVAAGLESLVVGETEISGQVADALARARELGTTSPALERLFQTAAHTSREVKNRTGIGRMGRSIVRLALTLCDSRIVDWSALRVLLIGTGQYARVTVAALRDRGVRDIAVHSASGRAETFARPRDLRPVDPAQVGDEVAAADLIVTCTTAPRTVLDAATLVAARDAAAQPAVGPTAVPERPSRQLVIDLGMPRNVAVDVADLPDVDLLDLETIRLHAPLDELRSDEAARELVDAAAHDFHEQRNQQRVGHGLARLKSLYFDVLDEEIARAAHHEPSAQATEKALRHLTGRLLHVTMRRSRELAARDRHDEVLAALDALYGITAEQTTPASRCGACPIAHELGGGHQADATAAEDDAAASA